VSQWVVPPKGGACISLAASTVSTTFRRALSVIPKHFLATTCLRLSHPSLHHGRTQQRWYLALTHTCFGSFGAAAQQYCTQQIEPLLFQKVGKSIWVIGGFDFRGPITSVMILNLETNM